MCAEKTASPTPVPARLLRGDGAAASPLELTARHGLALHDALPAEGRQCSGVGGELVEVVGELRVDPRVLGRGLLNGAILLAAFAGDDELGLVGPRLAEHQQLVVDAQLDDG